MSHTTGVRGGVRQAQKQKTRQALLDAALVLLEEQSLSSLGLREVTRAAGIAPTAFYRHFRDTADLGVALVDEALGSLHGTIRTTLAATGDSETRIAGTVELIAALVRDHPAHVRFVAREQHGGVRAVREAIAAQLDRFAQEVAEDLARQPETGGWPTEDLLMLAGLYVDHMVMTASALLGADAEARREAARVSARRLRLIAVGSRHWLD
ncbi:TetR family transcriptional regulator [Streptomyces sp. MUM 203J]|uniref:TetR family transcriptional regulator n=1 Tax=Streptomyces sp. MUM 203J TaxID=2791990 RepID=UPI001F03F597|nr:TetR family transcriptional regulator [Streptomyces sp. MUM 203J]MCH0538011.1 TetR family transcriptional regulator [Streptomyces sp. MUM 203J]